MSSERILAAPNGGYRAPARKAFVTFRGKVDHRRAAAAVQIPVSVVKGSPGWGSLAARGLVDPPIGGRLSDGQRRAAGSCSPSRQTRRDRRGRLTRWHAADARSARDGGGARCPVRLRGWRAQVRAQGPAGRSLPPATRGSAQPGHHQPATVQARFPGSGGQHLLRLRRPGQQPGEVHQDVRSRADTSRDSPARNCAIVLQSMTPVTTSSAVDDPAGPVSKFRRIA